MTDAEFARRFERGLVPPAAFHHREHLRVAWAYLQQSATTAEACDRMCAAIRTFAARVGHAGKYHETLTVFWVRLLAEIRARSPRDAELEAVLRANACLLDKDAPLAYYSRERLHSPEARQAFLAPDLRPLDSHAADPDSLPPPSDAPDRPLHRRIA